MKEQLLLRNKTIELEKKNDKVQNETITEMEATILNLKEDGQQKIQEGDVIKQEVKEDVEAMNNIQRKKVQYVYELAQWRRKCKELQDKITQVKYDDQIALAKTKRKIEAEYDERLEDFKA